MRFGLWVCLWAGVRAGRGATGGAGTGWHAGAPGRGDTGRARDGGPRGSLGGAGRSWGTPHAAPEFLLAVRFIGGVHPPRGNGGHIRFLNLEILKS